MKILLCKVFVQRLKLKKLRTECPKADLREEKLYTAAEGGEWSRL